jgi:hypothetical protein
MFNHEKGKKCKCDVCKMQEEGASPEEAMEKFKEWEREKIAEYGWVVHCVGEDPDSPTTYNIHTHGLPENFDHPDLQIVFPLSQEVAHPILTTIIERIKDGEKFSEGDILENVIQNGFRIKAVSAKECDRDVIRLIFPDPKGSLDATDMIDPYRRQYGDLVELPKTKWTPYKGKQ